MRLRSTVGGRRGKSKIERFFHSPLHFHTSPFRRFIPPLPSHLPFVAAIFSLFEARNLRADANVNHAPRSLARSSVVARPANTTMC